MNTTVIHDQNWSRSRERMGSRNHLISDEIIEFFGVVRSFLNIPSNITIIVKKEIYSTSLSTSMSPQNQRLYQ